MKRIHGNSVSCTQFCCGLFEIPRNFVAFNAKNELIETEISPQKRRTWRARGPKTYQVMKYQTFKGWKSETIIPRYIGVFLVSKTIGGSQYGYSLKMLSKVSFVNEDYDCKYSKRALLRESKLSADKPFDGIAYQNVM